MANISPLYGQVKLVASSGEAGTPAILLGARKCEIKGTGKTFKTTSTDSAGNESHIVGVAMKAHSISLELVVDTTEAALLGSPPLISAGKGVSFENLVDHDNYANYKWAGVGTITSCSSGWDVNGSDALTCQVEIEVSGALTATPTA